MGVPVQIPTGVQAAAMATLQSLGIPWFDDNPYAWQSWRELALSDGPSDWDLITILAFGPFLCKVKGRYGTKLDIKEAMGKTGATINNGGQKNTPVDVTLYLPTPLDLVNFVQLFPAMVALSDSLSAVDVSFPSLKIYSVGSLFLFEAETIDPPHGDEPGSVVLHFKEFKTVPQGPPVSGNAQLGATASVLPGATLPAPAAPTVPPTPSLAPPD